MITTEHDVRKLPDAFYVTFAQKLLEIFGPVTVDSFDYIAGTNGWCDALAKTCRVYSLDALMRQYDDLSLEGSDAFDDALKEGLKGVIQYAESAL